MQTRRTPINGPWSTLLAALAGSVSLLQCVSGESSGAGAPGNMAAFVGTWTCNFDSTATYSQPAGTDPLKKSGHDTQTFTQIGTNELSDGGSCPDKYRVSGNTASVEPGASCTEPAGETVSNTSGTATVSGDTLSGSVSSTITGTSNSGAHVVAQVTVKFDCVRGGEVDAGGAGGSASETDGAALGAGGGSSGGGSANGGSANGGSANGGSANGGSANGGSANDAGPRCGSYLGGAELGTCMSDGAAPVLKALYWPQDSCSVGEVCVAAPKAADPSVKFSPCGTASVPGACWPAYVPEGVVAGTGNLYPQGSCGPGETCMPCSNTVVPSLSFCDD